MGLILADHESGFELARQGPAFFKAGAILLVVLALVAARRRAIAHEHPRSPGVVLSYVAVAFTFAALVVGVAWSQQSSYVLCGPVLYAWDEPNCTVTMDWRRSWFSTLGLLAGGSFALSLFVAAVTRQDASAEAGAPPPGTSR
jgi:hypothetical protein